MAEKDDLEGHFTVNIKPPAPTQNLSIEPPASSRRPSSSKFLSPESEHSPGQRTPKRSFFYPPTGPRRASYLDVKPIEARRISQITAKRISRFSRGDGLKHQQQQGGDGEDSGPLSSSMTDYRGPHDHEEDRDKPKLENTYQLAPDPSKIFRPTVAKSIMEGILKDNLQGLKYDADKCRQLSKKLTSLIKRRIKERKDISKRYRYVCLVTIGEKREQGLQMSSRCLWAMSTDNVATAVYAVADLFAVALLYAVYMD